LSSLYATTDPLFESATEQLVVDVSIFNTYAILWYQWFAHIKV
jgi:hypothetical protein